MPTENPLGFIPYGRQTVEEDDIAAVVEVLRGDWLTCGPAVGAFEAAITARTGVPTVAVSSGTAALHAAYFAAGVGKGRSIVTAPLTFASTATTALALGARVLFVDVDDATLTMDPAAADAAADDRTAAIVPIDFAGHPAALNELSEVAERNGSHLVEDAAHSLGAAYDGRPVGAIASLTAFSFHPVKHVTTGEGGAVAVADPSLLDDVRRFRSHGMVRDPSLLRLQDEGAWHQEVHHLGLNYRLSDILAALGTSQLAKLDRFLTRRDEIVGLYKELLAEVDGLRLPVQDPVCAPAWHLFAVRVLDGRRREVYDHMRAEGIGVQVHYLPVHLHPLFSDLGYRPGSCPVAEKAYTELLSLPLYPGLPRAKVEFVAATLIDALKA